MQTPSYFAAQHLSKALGPYISSCLLDLIRAGFCHLGTTGRGELQPALVSGLRPEESNLFWSLAGIIVSCLFLLGQTSYQPHSRQEAQGSQLELRPPCFILSSESLKTIHGEITPTRLSGGCSKAQLFGGLPLYAVITRHPQRHTPDLTQCYCTFITGHPGMSCTFQEHHWFCRWGN